MKPSKRGALLSMVHEGLDKLIKQLKLWDTHTMSVTEVQATDIEGTLNPTQALKALSLRMNQNVHLGGLFMDI